MKHFIKFSAAFAGCFLLFLMPMAAIGAIILSYCFEHPFSYLVSGIILCISVFLHCIGRALLTLVRNAREELKADRMKRGKGERLTKTEREQADAMLAMQNESLLSSTEYKMTLKKGSKDPEADLDKLIGLREVKENVLRYRAQMQSNYGSMHMCFLGNPGTGKTTVVGILTAFLHRYKYIKKNEFISIDGNFLKSSADPLARTSLLLRKARGKVLFIDEAYALIQGDSGIGQQILATLLNEMENERDNFIVILAGYKKEMKALFDANSGLSSRIKNYFMFEDYTMEELKEIFASMIHEQGLVLDADTLDSVENVLIKKRAMKNFANARTVRNLAEKCLTEHAYNLFQKKISKENRYRLMPEDVVKDAEDSYFR